MVVAVTARLAALSRARRGRRVTRRRPRSSGTGSQAENLIRAARRRGGRAAPASAATVLMRAARRAGTSVEASPHRDRSCRHEQDGGPGERRRTRAADQRGARAGEQRGRQPSGGQSGRCGGQRDEEVLGEQNGGGQQRRPAGCLQQAHSFFLLGHPPAGHHRDAGHREQPEQPAGGHQDLLLLYHQRCRRLA